MPLDFKKRPSFNGEPLEIKVHENVKTFDAVGDGIADDTAEIQAAISATPSGGTVFVPATADEYKISDTLTVSQTVTISSNGATIHQTGTGKAALSITASDVHIEGLRLLGRQRASMTTGEAAVTVAGANWAGRLNNVTVCNCEITQWGIYGVHMLYVEECAIERNHIDAIAYGGIVVLSGEDVTIAHNVVRDIDPGNGNAYGIALSHSGGSLEVDPRSTRCKVLFNVVDDVPTWEGIDTHGGSYHRFIGNTVTGCKVGLALQGTPSTDGPVIGFVIADNIVMQPTPTQQQAMTLTGTNHVVRGNQFRMSPFSGGADNYNTVRAWDLLNDCTFEGNYFLGTGQVDANNAAVAGSPIRDEEGTLNRNVLRDNVFDNYDVIVAAVKGSNPSWYWGGGNRVINQVGDAWLANWYQLETGTITYKGRLTLPSAYFKAGEPAAPWSEGVDFEEFAGKVLATGGLGVGNSASATTPGSVVKKMEVFDASGASLGFVPIYDAIT